MASSTVAGGADRSATRDRGRGRYGGSGELRTALQRLAPRQRAVIVLRYFEELTEAETAAELGISVGTVKSQARDALTRLKAGGPLD